MNISNMDLHIIRLIIIMTTCGIGGGIINYFMVGNLNKIAQKDLSNDENHKKDKFSMSLWKCIFTGIGASFLVPLLLKMISSNLLETSGKEPLDYFIISGFCLVASISSTRFITTISEKVLRLAKETKEDVEKNKEEIKQTKEDVESVQNALSDTNELLETSDASIKSLDVASTLTNEDIAILKAFEKSKYIYRTLRNLSVELKLGQEDLKQKLSELNNKKLIGYHYKRDGAQMYFLTFQGKMEINKNDNNS